MLELIPSKYMREYFEEIGWEFTDFEKATLIWNAPSTNLFLKMKKLEQLVQETNDARLREQIFQRLELGNEEKIDAQSPRFETAFVRHPFPMQIGTQVKDVTTGKCGVLATDSEDWEKVLKEQERYKWEFEYGSMEVVVYELQETGQWIQNHINPLYLELALPEYSFTDEISRTFMLAMDAFGDYLYHNHIGRENDGKLAQRYAQQYAKVCKECDEKDLP